MRSRVITAILTISLLLVACTPKATVSPTSLPTVDQATAISTLVSTATTPIITPTSAIKPTAAITPSGPATCQVVVVVPTPDPTTQAVLPAIKNSEWSEGSETALVTIIEYADFQDKSSAQLHSILESLREKYPEGIRLVFRHYPLYIYDKDQLSAQAAEAAGLQGKFWQFHDLLFNSQDEWISNSSDGFTTWAIEKGAEMGLNADQFKTDMLSQTVIDKVNAARAEVVKLNEVYNNFNFSDPFLFINGFPFQAPYSTDILTSLVEYFKLSGRAYTECPPMTVDPSKSYTATLHTEKGDVVIELYADKALWAVNSFIFLAQNGWYDNSGFFRVIPGFVAQAGDPSNSGLGTPGYSFSDELTPDLRFNKAGVVGMANSGANTNSSQFFITYAAAPSLDGKYTVFGQVISGMDVLTTLRPRNPDSDAILLTPDPILSVTIEVK